MNTLSISSIFSNLSDFQQRYLSILTDPEQYYLPVKDAYVEVWPAPKQPLYLGDLLQLWLGEKWIVNETRLPLINTVLREKSQSNPKYDHYVYAIQGNLLTGQNTSEAWSKESESSVTVQVGALFQYYCVWKSLKRPKASQNKISHAI